MKVRESFRSFVPWLDLRFKYGYLFNLTKFLIFFV
jgi:hypothetical protein